jgi:hypothetical protein
MESKRPLRPWGFDAAQINREILPAMWNQSPALEQWMHGGRGLREAKPAYTLTPDQHFVIDQHPTHANLILCGAGHGFKFAPVGRNWSRPGPEVDRATTSSFIA